MIAALIGMKLAVFRHGLTGRRMSTLLLGALLGIAAAGFTMSVAADSSASPELLSFMFAVWTVGWVLGPVLGGGGEDPLKIGYFAMVPISPRRLAAGLLVGSLAGIGPLLLLAAFSALVARATFLGPAAVVTAVAAVPLQTAFVVLLAKVLIAALGAAMRSRRGRYAGITLVLALGASGLTARSAYRSILSELRSDTGGLPAALWWLPPGWGVSAITSAPERPLIAVALIAALLGLCLALLQLWAALIRLPPTSGTASAGRSKSLPSRFVRWALDVLPATPVNAVLGKELHTWLRSSTRAMAVLVPLVAGTVTALLLVGSGSSGLAICAPALALAAACLIGGNLYGFDGTAGWLELVTPGAERPDVRGRQLAWLAVITPPLAVLATVLLVVTTPDRLGWAVAAALPAMLGTGSGVVVAVSILAANPVSNPREDNPLAGRDNPGLAGLVFPLGGVAVLLVTAAPAAAIAYAGLPWLGVLVAVLTGIAGAWCCGRSAIRMLVSRGPELLAQLSG
ncbi:ABC-2 type transport system permease protein [Amycolatopsis echigonensis]|uniref:ABC-2 type transport system permease protein n=1 Tax=Amycolatopsis echigonensis TaxID=2576905 RepID=A0A2N3WJ95_9PSEU|nr:hypothetical protein [Amycolatopsis niigatensis]PKV93947.1 ABC-2 type transport system permease protein [Amycolatopsis niigatensis]